jgi:Fe-S-cluster containining protein
MTVPGFSSFGFRRRLRAVSRRNRTTSPEDARKALERHVVAVQRTIRSCSGCGLCCTKTYNVVQILPVEADRIARHLATLPPRALADFEAKLERTVKRHRLADDATPRRYTCAFLEDDFRCALPLAVKPIACLAFNPITPDACDQEPEWYHRAHEAVAVANRDQGHTNDLRAIPIATLAAIARSQRH